MTHDTTPPKRMVDLISREAALAIIDPGDGDFHAGNYNGIAALPTVTGYTLTSEAEARGRNETADYALALEQELRDRAEQPKPSESDFNTSESDFDCLILDAMAEASRAMRKFPQPNYVISKIAEEAGEVVKAAIHCAEGRETAENLRSEMKQLIAMLYRLWAEGDQVHGLPSVHSATLAEAAAIRAAKGESK